MFYHIFKCCFSLGIVVDYKLANMPVGASIAIKRSQHNNSGVSKRTKVSQLQNHCQIIKIQRRNYIVEML